ncbi:hypothetical protein Tco_1353359 [Tanacetum coccineum]
MESLNSNSQERGLHQLQQMQDNAKESCLIYFRLLHSFLQVLSYDEPKSKRVSERAFMTLFGQDNENFTSTIEMTEKLFAEYTGIQIKQFRETLLLHMGNVKKSVAERTRHKRQYDRRMSERQMQSRESKDVLSKALDDSLVITECSRTKSDEHIKSSKSRTYITHVVDAYIRPVNDQVPSAEVHLTAPHNALANEQQHTNQSELRGEIDQDDEQDQVKSPLLKAEFLKMNDMVEKEVYNELSNRFLQLEKHCISLEISMQQKEESFQSNKPCKNQDAPEFCEFFEINDLKAQLQAKTTLICNLKNQIKSVKEASNEAKTKDHNDSLIAQVNSKTVENADLKAQIQEKVNSCAKVQSPKTRNNNKLVEPKTHTQKPCRHIAIGRRFSLNKSSTMYGKPHTPRSCLRWKPTGRIFKNDGLRWIHTRKMFTDNTTKVGSEPLNGSNEDITNPYECKETLNVSAGLALQKQMTSVHISSGLALQQQMASADNTSSLAP